MEVGETKSVRGTIAWGRRFARRLRRGDCVALSGVLGAGKTALVRGIALGLGLKDSTLVSSPTFVLVQEYPTQPKLYHLDLYRLGDAGGEFRDLGAEEMLGDGVVTVEWADRAPSALPRPRWEIRIQITGTRSRRMELSRVE